MLAALIIYLIRRLRRYFGNRPVRIYKSDARTMNALILFFYLGTGVILSQENKQAFKVERKGKSIGVIEIRRNISDNLRTYNLTSKIKARIVFNFDIYGEEKTVFKNNKLTYSSVYRRFNNNEKVNKQLTQLNGDYSLSDKGKSTSVNLPVITHNLHSLYFEQPGPAIQEIYCDNLATMVRLWRLTNNKIKVEFPNGDYNVFTYKDGLCVKVDVFKAFYKVQLIPIQGHES